MSWWPVIKLLSLLIALVAAYGAYAFYMNAWPFTPKEVACTMEAKLCPDGSYVGRTGPNCEFTACPGEVDISSWKTYTNTDIGYEFRYPATWSIDDQSAYTLVGHYIILNPPNPEPFTIHFSVTLDNRDLATIRRVHTNSGKQEAVITFAGKTAYTYSDNTSAKYPIYIPHNGKILVISAGSRPAEIDQILSTFKFIP